MEEEEREYPPATRYYITVVDELNNLLKNSFEITTDACRQNGALAWQIFCILVSSPFSNLPGTK
ncbi:hypothetical protein HOLleu_43827 [Holothuria leucospilota]|uniref:Uncharacterized protein n=1 Tax=Holothuria leucospilota TaxID=206669 RepID=A0A9Q1BAI7_HOLLE|nr:hypothetical protein HOLleu_43827 [Holothuria leucospilota]